MISIGEGVNFRKIFLGCALITGEWRCMRTLFVGKQNQLLDALNCNTKYIRGLVSSKLQMKFTPKIRYRVDTALDYVTKIEKLLQSPEVARDLKKED